MTGGVYKYLDLVGTSPNSMEEAIRNAVEEASKTVRHINWFEVKETRGRVENGKIVDFQVALRLGFKLE